MSPIMQATSYQPPMQSSLASPARNNVSEEQPRTIDAEPEILDGEEGAVGRLAGEANGPDEEEVEETEDKREQAIMALSGPEMESIKVEDGKDKNRM